MQAAGLTVPKVAARQSVRSHPRHDLRTNSALNQDISWRSVNPTYTAYRVSVHELIVFQALFQQINPCQIVEPVATAQIRAPFTFFPTGTELRMIRGTNGEQHEDLCREVSHETTELQLRESFTKFGDIASLANVTDKEEGKSRGSPAGNDLGKTCPRRNLRAGRQGARLNVLRVSEAKKT